MNNHNYKERIDEFLFKKNWIEAPVYYNNKGKVLRFDLLSKSETGSVKFIKNIFDDVFYIDNEMIIIFYGTKLNSWRKGKKYFKFLSLKKIFVTKYESKIDDMQDEDPYIVACLSKVNKFKFSKYLVDYLADKQSCQIAFISLKKGVALQMYDSRGFDLLSVDKDFLKFLYKKYNYFIIEYDRKEILENLKN